MGSQRTSALPGVKRGMLTFVNDIPRGRYVNPRALFLCDCGNEVELQIGNWQSGNTTSCGCARGTHRQHKTPLYRCWSNMRTRAQKVGLDPRWETYEGFLASQPTAGPSPIDGLTRDYAPGLCLCRTRDTGPYSPENCRWDTRSNNSREQVNPTKLTPDQVRDVRARYAAGGITQTALGSELGVSKQIIQKACANNQRST